MLVSLMTIVYLHVNDVNAVFHTFFFQYILFLNYLVVPYETVNHFISETFVLRHHDITTLFLSMFVFNLNVVIN